MELKYRFSKTSISRMKAVDPRLIILATTYMCMGKKDIGVTYGVRTKEAQEHMLATGKSKVKNSKHIPIKETITTPDGFDMETMESNAIDIVAYKNGKSVWDREFYEDIIKDMKKIVKFYGWQNIINFGWDFKTLNDPYHISVKEANDNGIK